MHDRSPISRYFNCIYAGLQGNIAIYTMFILTTCFELQACHETTLPIQQLHAADLLESAHAFALGTTVPTHVIVTLANMHRVSQAETAFKIVLLFHNDMCFGKCLYVCMHAGRQPPTW